MHLKRLELTGFKSFAQKTVLDFPAGIAAVVGPNGAGKSNIIDAIRWLLGEREAKNMRSLKAEDLIFSGTPHRPRLGLAQATIVFDNRSRFFPVDYTEVAIRRRLDREGSSEYFLNEAAVRLKDIIDFFAKSRLGTKGFSIVNQGDSDLFVRALPKERLSMLEEILGLRQFQLKKHEAELKLASTKSNMEKARALIDELLPHLRLLRRQTVKWAKHADLEQELKDLENKFFGFKLAELEGEAGRFEPELKKLNASEEKLKNELKHLEAEFSKIEERQPKKDKDWAELSAERGKLFQKKSELTRELGKLEAQMDFIAKEAPAKYDGLELVRLLEEIRETLEDALLETDIKVVKKLLKFTAEKIGQFFEENQPAEVRVKTRESSALEAAQDRFLNEIEAIDSRLSEIAKLEQSANKELKNFNSDFRACLAALEAKRASLKSIADAKNRFLIERERIVVRREELERQAREIGKKLDDFKAEIPKEFDVSGAERRIFRLRGELAAIGEIDPGLVKEAEVTEARYQFLSKELADLEKAYKDLTALIKDLEEKIHTDFARFLKEMNEQFHHYFRLMFGGGQAKLKIRNPRLHQDFGGQAKSEIRNAAEEKETEKADEISKVEIDELDSGGLEIELNVPRKRIHSLDMLSGGEKSLVSLAVLFALISVSPPPFLVLDEVDAALDEQNSKRFASLIKDFSKKTQFLLVTHNRATMEAADLLYGVTMGEDGTSKVLSLKLE